jgi:hypothetical protein
VDQSLKSGEDGMIAVEMSLGLVRVVLDIPNSATCSLNISLNDLPVIFSRAYPRSWYPVFDRIGVVAGRYTGGLARSSLKNSVTGSYQSAIHFDE